MSSGSERDRELDFIVIGVQKGGTTSLWRLLRRHPAIVMPDFKEAPVFCLEGEEVASAMLTRLMEIGFGEAPPGTRLGKVATHYMMGLGGGVERVTERIARALPRVRLIALLRDPIERAISHYRMSLRRGLERRSFDTVVEELLAPDRLEAGRSRPNEINSYLTQGEYGRVLRIYRSRFSPEQLHVETTADLDREPGYAIDRVLRFLGLPAGYRPADLGVRHYKGGAQPRVDAQALGELRDFMREDVWPKMGREAENVERAFDFFLQIWNVIPDDSRPSLSKEHRRRLEAHFRADGEILTSLGIEAPWLDAWGDQ